MFKKLNKILALSLILCLLCGCAAKPADKATTDSVQTGHSETAATPGQDAEVEKETTTVASGIYSGERPVFLKNIARNEESSVMPCVDTYTIAPDLSNVENLEQFYLQDELAEKLAQNGFVVCGGAGSEFFEIYEANRYMMTPNFITVDSLMHTYHLYFGYLLKNIERDYLFENLAQLSERMLANSISQYEQLTGSEWEEAAKRNVAFFSIGSKLLDGSTVVHDAVQEIVTTELDRIRQADGIYPSEITRDEEDYTQYIPRGYYEGDSKLEPYFKAMMWYGRMHFSQESEEMDRSALLITKALADDSQAYDLWKSIYAVTSFFAGASDDNGVCEYAPVIKEAYGEEVSVKELAGNADAFSQYHALTATLSAPQINSIPTRDWEDNVIPGFRFMGQRFTIDASIMQKLIYSSVEENSQGMKRMLPDVLDVPAALGSEMALQILTENGATDYTGYSENMEQLQTALAEENEALWSASLYAGWLNTLRPLLTEKGQGYPVFMQSEEWMKKDLECFAGSFTELKHDTILYSKQVMAEMGGGYEEEIDFRGYVEPEPLVYERFAALADRTAAGLKEYGMLSEADEENLSRLSQIAVQLLTISKKELQEEVLTDEEYEFIECYGGSIEHFWYEAARDGSSSEAVNSQEYPAAIAVDIATDPNGTVLEAATGNPSEIYVVVKVDGKLKIATGSVYSFYQFPWPLENRLTDSAWRQMMGLQADENGYYHYDNPVQKPEWTGSYRYKFEWE